MSQQVSDPPNQQLPRAMHLQRNAHTRFSKAGILSLLILIGLLLLVFSSLLIASLPSLRTAEIKRTNGPARSVSAVTQRPHPTSKSSRTLTPSVTQNQPLTPTVIAPIFTPNNTLLPALQLEGGHYIIYEQQSSLYVVSSTGDFSEVIAAPGLVYSEAVRPILTPSGQILYSGNGIWLTDIFGGTPMQIADLAPGQVITSMALSNDGKALAWSTEPVDGNGLIDIHAGPVGAPSVVYEQSALNCPCFRIFSFMQGSPAQADNTLLLTDDRGSHEAVQNGLWSLDLTSISPTPLPILDEDPQQGPLALTPNGNTLLYSTDEGAAPVPSDNSVPSDIAVLSYANSLDLTTLKGPQLALGASQIVLPEQDNLSNSAAYHWVTTPVFSPDGHTLAYVEFSSDAQDPYDRHSALYTVQITGSGSHLHVSKPQLLATTTASLLELGPCFNNAILTIYGDGVLYAMDTQTGALTTLARPGEYARVIAIVGSPSGG